MDSKLRKALTECIREIETGSRDVEGCLQQRPERAAELRPHLELWSRLNTAPKAQPNFGGQQRGQHQLLGALADMEKEQEQRTTRFLTPVLVKAAAVVVGVALLAGGAAGASAALGGPDVGGQILSAVGLDNAWNHAAEQAKEEGRGLDNARDHANPSAFEGANNAEGAGAPEDAPPESVPASDAVPEDVNLPDPLPAGPKP